MNSSVNRSPFIFPETRLRLASLLRINGFQVRMHGYEYLISYGNAFLCLILLQPFEATVLIKVFKWIEESSMLVERIIGLVKTIDKQFSVNTY